MTSRMEDLAVQIVLNDEKEKSAEAVSVEVYYGTVEEWKQKNETGDGNADDIGVVS